MTRINVIPVDELVNKHLLAEYHEITRVFGLVKKSILKGFINNILINKTKYETPSEIAVYLNIFDIPKNLTAKLSNNIINNTKKGAIINIIIANTSRATINNCVI